MARTKGMLNLSGNLEVNAGAPLDARSVVPTVADLTVAANFQYKYVGMPVVVQATGDMYVLTANDVTVAANWKQIGSGGGGTSYTAGDGIVIENDEISTDNMPAADMSEIVTPLPSVGARLPILFDEQSEERVVGWYRYSNGTKKKVYEKTYSVSSVSSTSKLVDSSMKLSNVTLVGFINNGVALGGNYNGTTFQGAIGTGMHFRIWNDATGGLYCNIEGGGSVTATQARFSVQYTKTTDTAI